MALISTEERNYLLYYGFDHFKNLKHEESQLCMNINEDAANNLKFFLKRGKIDIHLKDQ